MTTRKRDGGFSLVEVLVAMVVTVVCLLGVALLILYGTRLGSASRQAAVATALARAEIERLRVIPRSEPERQTGGSLSADVAAHYRRQGRLTSRWVVAPGPAGTQELTLAVGVLDDAHVPGAQLRVLLR
jgi:Tfp pilus assembly protein PilV